MAAPNDDPTPDTDPLDPRVVAYVLDHRLRTCTGCAREFASIKDAGDHEKTCADVESLLRSEDQLLPLAPDLAPYISHPDERVAELASILRSVDEVIRLTEASRNSPLHAVPLVGPAIKSENEQRLAFFHDIREEMMGLLAEMGEPGLGGDEEASA